MTNKYITLFMAIASAWGLYSWQYRYHEELGRFCPYNKPCFHRSMPKDAPILVAYLSHTHWNAMKPWLVYWDEEASFKEILIVNYEGQDLTEWQKDIHALSLQNISFLKDFDSSPYGFLPMEGSPALYQIDDHWVAQGPYYRFDEVAQ